MAFPERPLAARTTRDLEPAPPAAVQVLHDLIDAFNRHDADAFAAPFVEDAWFLNVIGFRLSGRDEIAAAHRYVFATVLAGSRVRCTDVASRSVGVGVALIEAVWESAPNVDGTEPSPARTGVMNLLLRSDDNERWRVVSGANVEFSSPE